MMNKLSNIEKAAERKGWTLKACAYDANDNQCALNYIDYKGEYAIHRVHTNGDGIHFESGTYCKDERSALAAFYNGLAATSIIMGEGE